jgi:hypothetical protein
MALRTFVSVCGLAAIATACGVAPQSSGVKSLTGDDYKGTKYYFGWGLNGNGNGSMDNEVKYDVLHTHDIFTKAVGGNYAGTKLIGTGQVTGSAIKSQWRTLSSEQKAEDMYLQYSSGHGYPGGLEAGVTYSDIINNTLSMPAKEKVIFTMACYSGGLVDAFNQQRSRWTDYQSQGKTLFVMASSKADEESSTGPGTDPDQPNSPNGSAGSAFGHSLWKALIGYADKPANGGNGDGVVTLSEITHYVVDDTEAEGGHTPVFTGSYNPQLQIARTPTFQQARTLLGDTDEGRTQLETLMNDGVLAAD